MAMSNLGSSAEINIIQCRQCVKNPNPPINIQRISKHSSIPEQSYVFALNTLLLDPLRTYLLIKRGNYLGSIIPLLKSPPASAITECVKFYQVSDYISMDLQKSWHASEDLYGTHIWKNVCTPNVTAAIESLLGILGVGFGYGGTVPYFECATQQGPMIVDHAHVPKGNCKNNPYARLTVNVLDHRAPLHIHNNPLISKSNSTLYCPFAIFYRNLTPEVTYLLIQGYNHLCTVILLPKWPANALASLRFIPFGNNSDDGSPRGRQFHISENLYGTNILKTMCTPQITAAIKSLKWTMKYDDVNTSNCDGPPEDINQNIIGAAVDDINLQNILPRTEPETEQAPVVDQGPAPSRNNHDATSTTFLCTVPITHNDEFITRMIVHVVNSTSNNANSANLKYVNNPKRTPVLSTAPANADPYRCNGGGIIGGSGSGVPKVVSEIVANSTTEPQKRKKLVTRRTRPEEKVPLIQTLTSTDPGARIHTDGGYICKIRPIAGLQTKKIDAKKQEHKASAPSPKAETSISELQVEEESCHIPPTEPNTTQISVEEATWEEIPKTTEVIASASTPREMTTNNFGNEIPLESQLRLQPEVCSSSGLDISPGIMGNDEGNLENELLPVEDLDMIDVYSTYLSNQINEQPMNDAFMGATAADTPPDAISFSTSKGPSPEANLAGQFAEELDFGRTSVIDGDNSAVLNLDDLWSTTKE